jgi:hypothetical protein
MSDPLLKKKQYAQPTKSLAEVFLHYELGNEKDKNSRDD